MHKFVSVCLLIVMTGLFSPASGAPSVGVGTGKIIVDTPVQAGKVVTLPQIAVFNDGTSAGSFFIEVTNNEKQEENKVISSHLKFTPQKFELGPGESQLVSVSLEVPAEAEAGNYFGYIEAAAKTSESGMSKINAVAAAKLYFTIQENVDTKSAAGQGQISSPGLPVKNAGLNQLFATSPIL